MTKALKKAFEAASALSRPGSTTNRRRPRWYSSTILSPPAHSD
jgi:hypothetical protein